LRLALQVQAKVLKDRNGGLLDQGPIKMFSKFVKTVLSGTFVIAQTLPMEAAHRGNSTPVAALEIYTAAGSCAPPPSAPNTVGTSYYVDAAVGSDGNDGLAPGSGHAFATVQKATNVATNNGTGSTTGATINVYGGSYVPPQDASGHLDNSANTFWVWVRAVPGQTVIFTSSLQGQGGSSKWIFQGFKFKFHGNNGFNAMAYFSGANGNNRDIILDSNEFESDDPSIYGTWTQHQWQPVKDPYFGLALDHPQAISINEQSFVEADVDNATAHAEECIAVTNNHIHGVGYGIGISGRYILVKNNVIERIVNDGIDWAASHIEISFNTVKDQVADGDENHNDSIQRQQGYCNYATAHVGPTCYFKGVVVNANLIEETTQAWTVMPLSENGADVNSGDAWDTGADGLQGITGFNEGEDGSVYTNNIIVDTGGVEFALYSMYNSTIANNTVAHTFSNGGSGLLLAARSHEANCSGSGEDPYGTGGTYNCDTASNSNIVRNNICPWLTIQNADTDTLDHNLIADSGHIDWDLTGSSPNNSTPGGYPGFPSGTNVITATVQTSIFTALNRSTYSYDLHLLSGSLASGAGTSTGAPNKADGTPRTGTPDLGAY
jgi:hypothetical protein